MWIADAARCREIDRLSQAEFGVASESLMLRAGEAVLEVAMTMLPASRRLTVLCGKGNNGGDGFVVARLGKLRGLDVRCIVAALPEDLSPDAAREARGMTAAYCDDPTWLDDLRSADLIVDALLGTGFVGKPSGPVAKAIEAIASAGVTVVSVDIPSGIECDTGIAPGSFVRATRTVTFGLPKPFLFQGEGARASGEWSVADIGFPQELIAEPTTAYLIDRHWAARRLPMRSRDSNKGENGRVLVIAGSHRMRGAAVLAGLGALRSGAGLVTVASVPSVCDAVAARLPEATLLPLPECEGAISSEAANMILEASARFDAAVIGPGLTTAIGVREFLRALFANWDLPTCFDADALNGFALGVPKPQCPSVCTPHPGEISRLLNCTVDAVQADRFGTARRAAETFGTTLLKGAFSIIARNLEPLFVNPTGNAGMAAGGMGDVLSGIVGTLLAQGLEPSEAAACAAYWHGLSGDLCGPPGYLASDVASRLPEARAKINAA